MYFCHYWTPAPRIYFMPDSSIPSKGRYLENLNGNDIKIDSSSVINTG